VHWTKWQGEKLVKSSEPYDQQYAHKPFILSHDGVVYHFYCAAVGARYLPAELAASGFFNGLEVARAMTRP
jgi:hypothetical protein